MENDYYQIKWILQEYYIVCGKCVTMCWGWFWCSPNPFIAQPRPFNRLPKVYTKPHETCGLPMGGHVTGGIGLLKGNSYVTVYLKKGYERRRYIKRLHWVIRFNL